MSTENNKIDFDCAMGNDNTLSVELVNGNNLIFLCDDIFNYEISVQLKEDDAKKLRDFLNKKLR